MTNRAHTELNRQGAHVASSGHIGLEHIEPAGAQLAPRAVNAPRPPLGHYHVRTRPQGGQR